MTLTILLTSVTRLPETCKMRAVNFRVCVCWLAVCHAAQMPFILTDNVPHLLSDELLISRASDIHVRRGTYTVLVVIDAPRRRPRMEERLNELRLVIEELGTHQNDSKCLGAAHPRHFPRRCFPTHELNEVCSILRVRL